MAQELENAFQPAHELRKEAVIVYVDFMYEFVEIVLVTTTKVDERLHGLIWVGRDVLSLGFVEDSKGIVGEERKISDAIIDICRFVNADKRLIEDGKEVPEKLESDRL